MDLTVEQVGHLLTSLNLAKFRDAFAENGLDGHMLGYFESPDELEDLGIALPVQRKGLFHKIQSYKQGGVPRGLVHK